MIWPIATLTLRECFRRKLPYVLAIGALLVLAASRMFLSFTFGRLRGESLNLAISGCFLAGFALTGLLGATLVRADLERKTLDWLLTKPLGLPHYLAGRLTGLFLANAIVAGVVAVGIAPLLVAMGGSGDDAISLLDVLFAAARAAPPLLVLSGAALMVSAVASRTAAPLLLLALFLAGTLAGRGALGWIIPDLGLFALDANATAPGPLAPLYALVFCSIFTVTAYIFLAVRFNANR